MKKVLFVLVAVLALLALVAVPSHTTLAAADATCVSDPSSGPVGTTFVMTCWGYTPNSYVYAYLVEPAGVATTLFGNGAIKVDESGYISYSQPSAYQPFVTLATGTWGFVAEETGLAKAVIHRGETTFTITGGTEGVSGASLSADPMTINKPIQGTDHIYFSPFTLNFLNVSDPVTLSGSGFAPYEMVSFWVEPAGGGCPSSTVHYKWKLGIIITGVGGVYANYEENDPIFDSYGAQAFGTVKADASGNAAISAFFTSLACEGAWHFVARGNASGWGADTHVTVIGNVVETTASLSASPGSASAMFDRIWFSGSGFAPNEHVSCWLTSPRGQTLGFPIDEFFTLNIPPPPVGFYSKNQSIFAGPDGSVSFDMVTGSVYIKGDLTLVIGGVSDSATFDVHLPIQSEGALGEWAMTCRGDTSGANAIARFTLTGGFVDP